MICSLHENRCRPWRRTLSAHVIPVSVCRQHFHTIFFSPSYTRDNTHREILSAQKTGPGEGRNTVLPLQIWQMFSSTIGRPKIHQSPFWLYANLEAEVYLIIFIDFVICLLTFSCNWRDRRKNTPRNTGTHFDAGLMPMDVDVLGIYCTSHLNYVTVST